MLCVSNSSYAQMPQCCAKVKKVKIKKGKKRRKGTLRGVKGYDDKKALKNQIKASKSKAKAKRKELKELAQAVVDSTEAANKVRDNEIKVIDEKKIDDNIIDENIIDEKSTE